MDFDNYLKNKDFIIFDAKVYKVDIENNKTVLKICAIDE
jgi:hypothetical protein